MTAEPAERPSPYNTTLRRLHLAIALFVIALAATGFSIYFRKPLGLQELKLTLVFTHACLAYAFLVVLALRIFLAFRGDHGLGFGLTMPRRKDIRRLFAFSGKDRGRFKLAGRSPLSRTIAGVLFVVFCLNAATGLIRAGTDLYFPPFGPFIRAYVAADGVDPALVKPVERKYVDATRYKTISRGKLPFGKIHIYGAFVIAAFALVHAVGVIVTEWSPPHNPKARGAARLMLFGPGKN